MNVERKQIVVTVKAYPDIGKKYGEAVCVAGVDTASREWSQRPLLPTLIAGCHLGRKLSTILHVELRQNVRDVPLDGLSRKE